MAATLREQNCPVSVMDARDSPKIEELGSIPTPGTSLTVAEAWRNQLTRHGMTVGKDRLNGGIKMNPDVSPPALRRHQAR